MHMNQSIEELYSELQSQYKLNPGESSTTFCNYQLLFKSFTMKDNLNHYTIHFNCQNIKTKVGLEQIPPSILDFAEKMQLLVIHNNRHNHYPQPFFLNSGILKWDNEALAAAIPLDDWGKSITHVPIGIFISRVQMCAEIEALQNSRSSVTKKDVEQAMSLYHLSQK